MTPKFAQLLDALDISLVHMKPRQSEISSVTVAAQTMDAIKGLAIAYGVTPQDVVRACCVLGFEHMLGKAEEIGHYAPTPQDPS